jgi:hypothetical protein
MTIFSLTVSKENILQLFLIIQHQKLGYQIVNYPVQNFGSFQVRIVPIALKTGSDRSEIC